jgi:4a-hydroxytetrahydrobiopterin dehydratase
MSTPPPKLASEEVQTRLQALPHWSLREGRLQRELRFDSFERAFGFMTALALVAQRLNHHPEWFNVYNRVSIQLWTHDAGGITALDFALAEAAERLLTAAG